MPAHRDELLAETDSHVNVAVLDRPARDVYLALGSEALQADLRAESTTEPVADTEQPDLPADEPDRALPLAAGRLALYEPPAAPPNALAVEASAPGQMITVEHFTWMFERYQTPIINYVYRLVGNRDEANDLAQDTFIKAYRALVNGSEIQVGALSSWLYKIASNTATDLIRRRRLIKWLPLSVFNEDRGVGAGMPDSQPGSQQTDTQNVTAAVMANAMNTYDGSRFENRIADREIVEGVLTRMPPNYRTALLLYEYEGFTVAETAEALSISPSAVKMRLMRARERFIKLYRETTGEHLAQFFQPRRGRHNKQASQLRIAIQA